jgi:hypothetical protein
MSEAGKSDLSKRLGGLARQLLLALVNGTSILVIAAAILAIIATQKVSNLAQNVASTMTDAVLSRVVAGTPSEVFRSLQRVSDDVHTLLTTVKQVRVGGLAALDPEIARLNDRLGALNTNVEQLKEARSLLIDEAITKVSISLVAGLQNLRACPAAK